MEEITVDDGYFVNGSYSLKERNESFKGKQEIKTSEHSRKSDGLEKEEENARDENEEEEDMNLSSDGHERQEDDEKEIADRRTAAIDVLESNEREKYDFNEQDPDSGKDEEQDLAATTAIRLVVDHQDDQNKDYSFYQTAKVSLILQELFRDDERVENVSSTRLDQYKTCKKKGKFYHPFDCPYVLVIFNVKQPSVSEFDEFKIMVESFVANYNATESSSVKVFVVNVQHVLKEIYSMVKEDESFKRSHGRSKNVPVCSLGYFFHMTACKRKCGCPPLH